MILWGDQSKAGVHLTCLPSSSCLMCHTTNPPSVHHCLFLSPSAQPLMSLHGITKERSSLRFFLLPPTHQKTFAWNNHDSVCIQTKQIHHSTYRSKVAKRGVQSENRTSCSTHRMFQALNICTSLLINHLLIIG